MSKVDLLVKLSVEKDQRSNMGEVNQHSIKHTFGVLSGNFKSVFLTNLVYTVIFALPLLFCAFIWPLAAKSYFFTHYEYNFIGHIGIGYPGQFNRLAEGYVLLFRYYRSVYIPCLAASIVPAFLGLAGLFHCMRGYMWEEKVRPVVSFFRGIKKLWLPFLVTGIVVAAAMTGVFYGSAWYFDQVHQNAVTSGALALFIILVILTVLFISLLVFLLPMFACYRFKAKDALKNSGILVLVLWPTAIFTSAFTVGLFALNLANAAFAVIVCILMVFIGFAFLAGLWTSYAQKAFGNFIAPQLESALSGKPKMTAQKGVNPYKAAKAARQKQSGTAVGQASQLRNGGKNGKPKQQANRSNYKRK